MTVKAYILIVTEPGGTRDLCAAIRGITGVAEAHEVMGPYDIVAELEGESLGEITESLQQRIRSLGGIRSTLTCVAIS